MNPVIEGSVIGGHQLGRRLGYPTANLAIPDDLAVKNGVDLEQMKADMNSERVNQIMKDTSDLASKIQVNGVPALVINGKMVQTLDENVIQSAIDAAKK